MIYGLNQANQKINAADAVKSEKYLCPNLDCLHRELVLKRGAIKIPHFAHKIMTDCIGEPEPESILHLRTKLWLQDILSLSSDYIEYNNIKGVRPDVLYGIYAIEIQCSPITLEEIQRRNAIYIANNLIPIWIFKQETFTRVANMEAFELKFKISVIPHLFNTRTANQKEILFVNSLEQFRNKIMLCTIECMDSRYRLIQSLELENKSHIDSALEGIMNRIKERDELIAWIQNTPFQCHGNKQLSRNPLGTIQKCILTIYDTIPEFNVPLLKVLVEKFDEIAYQTNHLFEIVIKRFVEIYSIHKDTWMTLLEDEMRAGYQKNKDYEELENWSENTKFLALQDRIESEYGVEYYRSTVFQQVLKMYDTFKLPIELFKKRVIELDAIAEKTQFWFDFTREKYEEALKKDPNYSLNELKELLKAERGLRDFKMQKYLEKRAKNDARFRKFQDNHAIQENGKTYVIVCNCDKIVCETKRSYISTRCTLPKRVCIIRDGKLYCEKEVRDNSYHTAYTEFYEKMAMVEEGKNKYIEVLQTIIPTADELTLTKLYKETAVLYEESEYITKWKKIEEQLSQNTITQDAGVELKRKLVTDLFLSYATMSNSLRPGEYF